MTITTRKMFHECEKHGCWRERHLVDLTVFDDCLPMNATYPNVNRMSDADGWVMVGPYLLLMEWKGSRRIPDPQMAALRLLAGKGRHDTAIVVDGEPATMTVRAWKRLHAGIEEPWTDGDLEGLREAVRSWGRWAHKNGRD